MDTIAIRNHPSLLCRRLFDLQSSGELCDLRLTSKVASLDLHKVVLAGMGQTAVNKVKLCSTSAGSPRGPCILRVRASSLETMQAVVGFLYEGVLPFTKANASEIKEILEDLGLTETALRLSGHRFCKDTPPSRRTVATRSSPKPKRQNEPSDADPSDSQTAQSNSTEAASGKRRRIARGSGKDAKMDVQRHAPCEGSVVVKRGRGRPRKVPATGAAKGGGQHETAQAPSDREGATGVQATCQDPEACQVPSLGDGTGEDVSQAGKVRQVHSDTVSKERKFTAIKTEQPGAEDRTPADNVGVVEGDAGGLTHADTVLSQPGASTERPPCEEEGAAVSTASLTSSAVKSALDTRARSESESGGESEKRATTTSSSRGAAGVRRKSGQRTCYKCRKEFPSVEQCTQHRAICSQIRKKYDKKTIRALPFTCKKCCERFATSEDLKRHKEICKVKRKRIERKCRKCQKEFEDLEELRAHRRIHAAEWNKSYVRVKPVFRCDQCSYQCANEKSLLMHNTTKHDRPLEGSTKHPLLRCMVEGCQFRTLFQFQLKNHAEKHGPTRAYMCEVCGKAFKQRSVLNVHVHNVHSDARLSCRHCGKKLKTKMALSAHIDRVHRQVKNLSCPECSFQAFDLTTMETHRFSKHNVPFPAERKSYRCELCDYVTRWKSQFDAHMRRHSGECPFRCKECGKQFPAKSDLKSHSKWHFEKQFKCTYEKCRFSTCVPGKLKIHIRTVHTHRDLKPFVCHVCDYRTNLRSNLYLHLRKVHKLTVHTKATRVAPNRAIEDPVTVSDSQTGSAASPKIQSNVNPCEGDLLQDEGHPDDLQEQHPSSTVLPSGIAPAAGASVVNIDQDPFKAAHTEISAAQCTVGLTVHAGQDQDEVYQSSSSNLYQQDLCDESHTPVLSVNKPSSGSDLLLQEPPQVASSAEKSSYEVVSQQGLYGQSVVGPDLSTDVEFASTTLATSSSNASQITVSPRVLKIPSSTPLTKTSGRPLLIQLKSGQSQVITLQQLEQSQCIPEQLPVVSLASVSTQSLTAADMNLSTPVIMNQIGQADQLVKSPAPENPPMAAALPTISTPILMEDSVAMNSNTHPSQVVSVGNMYPVMVIQPSGETQRAADLISPYASLLQAQLGTIALPSEGEATLINLQAAPLTGGLGATPDTPLGSGTLSEEQQ